MNKLNLIAVDTGNTRTTVGSFKHEILQDSQRFPNEDVDQIVRSVIEAWKPLESDEDADTAILVASTNIDVSSNLSSIIEDQASTKVYTVGVDVPVPIPTALDPETITGMDRLLNAAAGWDRIKEAFIVIDAGSAVTVDFIDGEGVFHGGAIAPGASMMLESLASRTDALPLVELESISGEPFGKNTTDAIQRGVQSAIQGMVWRLTEKYSERYGGYPQIIATGGDAQMLFADDELINSIVPDLTLLGMNVAAKAALNVIDEDDDQAE
ncbi:MAG: hypothetical protein CMJ32_11365 [Phycisphaerae bacterium]|nr:hypothetical protein [Phycisphaerae bacterium]